MSSPHDVSFLADWRTGQTAPRLLVAISLTEPSAKTLRLSFCSVAVTASEHYHGALEDADPIEAPGALLSSGVDQSSWGFSIVDAWLPGQASSGIASQLLSAYRWQGAKVEAWFFVESGSGAKAPIFVGEIASVDSQGGSIRVSCLQRHDWNRTVTPTTADRDRYPRAPEKSLGLPVPIAIGDGSAQGLRGDWNGVVGTARQWWDRVGGGIPTAKGLLVDTGKGGGGANPPGTVLLASHAVEIGKIADHTVGCAAFMKAASGSPEFPPVLEIAGADVINASTGSGFKIQDDAAVAWIPVIGTEISNVNPAPFLMGAWGGFADNARALLDVSNEARYALIDFDANQKNVGLKLPAMDTLGTITETRLVVGYKAFAGVGPFQFFAYRATGIAMDVLTPAINTMEVKTLALVNAAPTSWDFSNISIGCAPITGAAGAGIKLRIYFMALAVKFIPRQEQLGTMRELVSVPVYGHRPKPRRGESRGEPPIQGYRTVENSVPVAELRGEFFGNLIGPGDDGSGTFTGTASARISRPCDVAHYILSTYLGQSAGQIETATGEPGSFNEARALLKTWRASDMKSFVSISSETSGEEILTGLARDSASWIYIDRFTDRFRWIPWRKDPAVTYPLLIEPEHVLDREFLKVKMMPSSRMIAGVRVAYLWDAFRGRFAGESTVTPDRSVAGYEFLGLRDELLTVTAGLNDRLDFIGTAVKVASLTPGSYSPMDATAGSDFARHVSAQMKAVDAGRDFLVAWGPVVVTGYNDKLDINDGAVKVATIPGANYPSMEALATAVTTALNTVSSAWSCTYSRTTKLFTISRVGTGGCLWNGGANFVTSIGTTLGFYTAANQGPVLNPTFAGSYMREEERFAVGGAHNAIDLLFETGANGLNNTLRNCATLLGFETLRDLSGGQSSHLGTTPKNSRETALALARTRYGSKKVPTVEARSIVDTATARELRNRLVDLSSIPLPLVSFRSLHVPDMRRGDVFEISSRFDSLVPYTLFGSDGSWAGKKFWALDIRQHTGPDRWETEVLGVLAP